MKKKLSLLVAFVVSAFALPCVVNAQASFTFDCSTLLSDTTLNNPSTTCTLSVLPDPNEEPITTVKVQMSSFNMTLNTFTVNDMLWQDGGKDTKGFYTLTLKDTGAQLPEKAQIGSVEATLKQDANSCGEVCVAVAYTTLSGTEVTVDVVAGATQTGDCTVSVTPGPVPPPTGRGTTMGNYIVLAGGAVIALAAISFARKSTKFYRV